MRDPAFVDEAGAWLDATFLGAQALRQSLRLLEAVAEGNSSDLATSRDQINHLVTEAESISDLRPPHSNAHPKVGDGVVDAFVTKAKEAGPVS